MFLYTDSAIKNQHPHYTDLKRKESIIMNISELPVEEKIIHLNESVKDIDYKINQTYEAQEAGANVTDIITRLNIQRDLLIKERENVIAELSNIKDLDANIEKLKAASEFKPITLYAEDFKNEMKNRKRAIHTGIHTIDVKLNGGFVDELYIMAAPTGSGKSAIASYMAQNIVSDPEQDVNVIYYALEMSEKEFVARGASCISFEKTQDKNKAIPFKKILSDTYDETLHKWTYTPYEAYEPYANEYFKRCKNLFIVRGNMEAVTATDICKYTTQFAECHPDKPLMLIVDYLQILSREAGDKDAIEQAKNAVHKFKILSMDLKMPVFLISSVPKSGNKGNITTSDFKDSNDIIFTGGVLIGWNLNEEEQGEKAAIDKANKNGYRKQFFEILKSRNGEKGGNIDLYYYAAFNYITDKTPAQIDTDRKKALEKENENIDVYKNNIRLVLWNIYQEAHKRYEEDKEANIATDIEKTLEYKRDIIYRRIEDKTGRRLKKNDKSCKDNFITVDSVLSEYGGNKRGQAGIYVLNDPDMLEEDVTGFKKKNEAKVLDWDDEIEDDGKINE